MKYVFCINSHTTFLTALGTIDYLSIKKEHVILAYMRDYQNSIIHHNYKIVDFNQLYNKSTEKVYTDKTIRKEFIKEVDLTIIQQIKDHYVLFAPHFGIALFQALYSNDYCVRGCYIQEGGIPFSTAYLSKFSLYEKIRYFFINYILKRSRRVFRPTIWYAPNLLFKQRNIDSFAINSYFFKYLPSENHIIEWPKVSVNISIEPEGVIFIFDGFVKQNRVESDLYLEACKRMIEEDSGKINYIRFHPAQSIKERIEIEYYFSSFGKVARIMDSSIPFELILSSCNNLKVVGLGSSLLFFARDLGHTVTCHDTWLLQSPKYQNYRLSCGFDSFNSK